MESERKQKGADAVAEVAEVKSGAVAERGTGEQAATAEEQGHGTGEEAAKAAEGLGSELEALRRENKAMKTEYEAKLREARVAHAVDVAIAGARVKNAKAVRALLELDADTAELDEGGAPVGLSERIAALRVAKDSSFLFEDANGGAGLAAGFVPEERRDGLPGTGGRMTFSDAVRRAIYGGG